MKDVEKTSVERENSSKRLRRRKRNMGLYGLIVIILVLGIGITVSCTFLFNINEIRVGGEAAEYTVEQVVEASGVSMGDNLIRLNSDEAEKSITDNLLYIESAEVHRDFPSALVINVKSCIPSFNISYEMGTLLVSEKGKILENTGLRDESLPVFYGFSPAINALGDIVTKEVPKEDIEVNDAEMSNTEQVVHEYEQGRKIVEEFMSIMSSKGAENNIVSVDLTDRSNIIVTFKDGNVFKMGNRSDLAYKLSLAERVISEVDGKIGYITMIGTNQCSFRTTEGSFTSSVFDDNAEEITSADDTSEESDDDGDSDENSSDESYVDPYEEMFREHDEMMASSSEAEENTDDYNTDENDTDGEDYSYEEDSEQNYEE